MELIRKENQIMNTALIYASLKEVLIADQIEKVVVPPIHALKIRYIHGNNAKLEELFS